MAHRVHAAGPMLRQTITLLFGLLGFGATAYAQCDTATAIAVDTVDVDGPGPYGPGSVALYSAVGGAGAGIDGEPFNLRLTVVTGQVADFQIEGDDLTIVSDDPSEIRLRVEHVSDLGLPVVACPRLTYWDLEAGTSIETLTFENVLIQSYTLSGDSTLDVEPVAPASSRVVPRDGTPECNLLRREARCAVRIQHRPLATYEITVQQMPNPRPRVRAFYIDGDDDSAVFTDAAECGNGVVEGSEVCDDGNRDDADECTNSCFRGSGAACTEAAECASRMCPGGFCASLCGNGMVDPGEPCDGGAGCTDDCRLELGQDCTTGRACQAGLCSPDTMTCAECLGATCDAGFVCVEERCVPDTSGDDAGPVADAGPDSDAGPGEDGGSADAGPDAATVSPGAGLAGGACSAAGSSPASWLFCVFALALVARRRRSAFPALVVGFAFGAPGFVQAQAGTLDRFAAGETAEDDFHLSRPTDLGHLRLSGQLHLDYANDPLVYETELGVPSSETRSAVEHQLNLTVGAAVGLFDRLVVFAGLPIVAVMNGESLDDVGLAPYEADGAGLGDLYLGARARILGDANDAISLGAQLTLTLPTNGSSRYRGENSLSAHPELLFEARASRVRLVANLGARLRGNQRGASTNLAFGNELTFGLGAAAPIWLAADPRTHVDVHVQVYGSSNFDDFFGRGATPLEALAGLKFFHRTGVIAGLAGGAGITRGFGSPDGRLVAMVGWRSAPEAGADADGDGVLDGVDACPQQPEDADEFEDADGCPDPDNDGDGVLDVDDRCPNERETANGFEDADGCPDEAPAGDADGDGIPDEADGCPQDAEDRDDFEDTDGCPDPDNDGDGVPDVDDQCPTVAGVAAMQGCPDPDRDGDGVVDRLDNCPDEVGTEENHGCAEAQQVAITDGAIEILDKVYFRTNRATIQPRSFGLLDNVAQVLNNHPEIERVRVEGHTDARGDHDYNVRLSQQRAEAVVTYLVEHGVTRSRLAARGFGPDRPIVADATSQEDHARNRRVEFVIEEGGEGIEQRDSGPAGSP